MTADFFTAAWALTDSVLIRTFALTAVLVGLAILAAACIAHRRDDSHDRTLAEIRALPTKEHA